MREWINRGEALERLGVKPQTLYAYVSRGRIAMRPDPTDPRRSLYNAGDIEGMRVRRARGRARSVVASSALAWGEPSIQTAISTIDHGRLIYRGIDAITFATTAAWEDAAALLWESEGSIALPSIVDDSTSAFAALAALIAESFPMLGRSKGRLHVDATHAIARLARQLGASPGDAPLHERLVHGWGLPPSMGEPLRRALVLLADHELNASTFAVRIAASTGASMAASLLAGLCALSGPRHGGAGAEALALLDEAQERGATSAVRRHLVTGRHLPGFGHPLYPAGDPRAIALLDVVPLDIVGRTLIEEAIAVCGQRPNIDFALAILTRVGGLPQDASFRLFALGRSLGWTAHAIEHGTTGDLIRPRATYTGALHD